MSSILVLLLGLGWASAAELYVDPAGNDANPGTAELPWKTIQKACDSATPGSTVLIRAGTYAERVQVNVSGNAAAGFITFRSAGPDPAILDNTNVPLDADGSATMILIENRSFVRVQGLEVRNLVTTKFDALAAGIIVRGAGTDIELIGNTVHHIESRATVDGDRQGRNAHGIGVFGTDGAAPLSRVKIEGNTVRNCVLGSSEALVLNGNVESFTVASNAVHDHDNIGIDIIGLEGTAPANDQARDGVVRGNTVYNITSFGNPAYGDERAAAGIYVDGGLRILIEGNVSRNNDFGIEIASEKPGGTTSGNVIRSNLFCFNSVTGIGFGGFDAKRGVTVNCVFHNNTLYKNDTLATGFGEIYVQVSHDNVFRNNIIVSGPQNLFIVNYFDATKSFNNSFDHNLYFSAGAADAARWIINETELTGLAAYRAATSQDANSPFADPLFVSTADPVDLHLQAASPAVNAGDAAFVTSLGETDVEGKPRLVGTVDLGAYESSGQNGGGDNTPSDPADPDGDGVPTELESSLGSSGSDPAQPVQSAAPAALAVGKLSIKLTFSRGSKDSLALSGTLPLPDGFALAGQVLGVWLGGVAIAVTLDAKGRAAEKGPARSAAFKLSARAKKGAIAAQEAPFKLTVSKAALAPLLSDDGLTGDRSQSGTPVIVPAAIYFRQQLFRASIPLSYTARAGKSGVAK